MAAHAPEQLLMNELQLLLAEQRTYFSLLRTGIAIFTLPLSVLVFLVATVRYHGLFNQPQVALLVYLALIVVSLLGLYLALHSRQKIQRIHQLMEGIRGQNKRLAELLV